MKTRVAFAVAMLASASVAGAQSVDTGPRWTGFLGCWAVAPADIQAIDRPDGMRLVCVTPTSDANVVHVSLRANGKEFFRDTVDASGMARAVERNGCSGSERASWSSDGRRVYLKSSLQCADATTDVSAIQSISASGDWVDVRSIHTRAGTDVQVTRYRDVGTPSMVPAEVAVVVTERAAAIKAARAKASLKLEAKDIEEVWKSTGEATLVEVWLLENGMSYSLDAGGLQQLKDAGVPAQVTDAAIAVDRAEKDGAGKRYAYHYLPFDERLRCYGCEKNRRAWDQTTGQRLIFEAWQYEDPWNFSMFGGFLGTYGQFGYPNRVRGSEATYGMLGSTTGRTSGLDMRPPVMTHINNVLPSDAKQSAPKEQRAKKEKDEGVGQQVADAIATGVEAKSRPSKPTTAPAAPKQPRR